MKVDLMRKKEKGDFALDSPEKVTSLRIWFCKFNSLNWVGECKNLKELVIAGLPHESLDFVSQLSELVYLEIVDLSKITSLESISNLHNLEVLALETPPSWDSSGKRMIVDSLLPIATLPKLKNLQLFRVCPENKSLSDLEKSASLVSVRATGYSKMELKRFYEVTSFGNQFIPESSFC